MYAIVILWFITFVFATLFQTIPISNNWSPHGDGAVKPPVKTVDVYGLYTTIAAMEILLDLVTLILPMPAIWRLQMQSARKWQIAGIFVLGSL